MQGTAEKFYASAQVRELDRRAAAAGPDAQDLMRRAAAAAWRELLKRWSTAQRIAVVCGPGNNGGDGYELARLAQAAGCAVRVWQVGPPPAGAAAAAARKAWLAGGGALERSATPALTETDVVVDAIFGIGLSRAPAAEVQEAILAINAAHERGVGVMALDVPSGLDADRGAAPGAAVRADLTVTFLGAKPGLHTGVGPEHSGAVVLDTLGAPRAAYDEIDAIDALHPGHLHTLLPRRARTAHKGDLGHVLLIGGDEGMAGAILLAARATLRAGAGLVSVATRAAHAAALSAAQPEVMWHGLEEPRQLRGLLQRASVLAVGPGLGRSDWSRLVWSQALSAPQPIVLDADALNWLAADPVRRDDWILTPHPGEAGRLLGSGSAAVQADRFAAARSLQERYGGTIVLKGAGTLVLGQAFALCPYGNPGMAAGGMGDVLCGLIAGLLAQGLGAEAAARAGVLAHALAGDRAAARGERGLLPSDLLVELRALLNPDGPTPIRS